MTGTSRIGRTRGTSYIGAGVARGTSIDTGTWRSGDSWFDYDFSLGVLPTEVTHSRASNALLTNVSGSLVYADANMFLNSATLATQNVTVIVGRSYTMSAYGTGSVALSNGASGTWTGTGAGNLVSLAFTATTTTATFTVTGSVTTAWLEPTSSDSPHAYHATADTIYYAPRFDYDPVTHALLGLLYEPQSTNKIIYSSNLTGTYWGAPTGGSVTTGNADLFGGTTGQALIQDTSTGAHKIGVTAYSMTNGAAATTTVYLKPVGAGTVYAFITAAGTGGGSGSVNLTTGAVFGSTTGTVTATRLPDGFVKIVLTNTLTAAYNTIVIQITNATGGNQSFEGDGASGFIIGGVQCEIGDKATSYIPTYGTALTRAAEAEAFTIPTGVTRLRYTFDDDSTQDATVSAGAYTIPTTLNRAHIKRIQGY